jgi:hypothetical protein
LLVDYPDNIVVHIVDVIDKELLQQLL